MPARTGEQFLKGLRGKREVWVDGERVRDVVDHPKLSGAAHALAEVFDLHHKQADTLLMADPETGEKIAVSHMVPKSREDLQRRHKALRRVAEYSVGLMGRTPDYMNVTYAGFAGSPVEWGQHGNEAGYERLVAYQKFLRRDDISLTHTIVQPTVDKAKGDAPAAGNEYALRKVGETEHGIVVRGARVLATLAPFADEIAVYPAAPLPEGADAYALSFCIPMTAPGLKFLCRDSMSAPSSNRFDHPLSSRFDEQDAFVIFDDVEVPRDRLFIDCNLKSYNTVMTRSWPPNVQQQTMVRASVKLDFAWGLALRMAASINAVDPETMRMIGELWGYAEFTRTAVLAAEVEAREWPGGLWTCAAGPMHALRSFLPIWMPRANEILRLIGSHNLLAAPMRAELADKELRPLIDKYLPGAKGQAAEERIRVFRLAWDFAGSALASRNEQYERFYLASSPRNLARHLAFTDRSRADRLVDRFLQEDF
ncbi:MAG TPA: 4-hydroxyphenylacetate 3-hydroxylase N-terminal domain-containing protein [Reyranella sp.]|nr:4-hydroxyphenylacetate 3-hydroxylase N-terminal domain-containing protein [Reyranella sp.]